MTVTCPRGYQSIAGAGHDATAATQSAERVGGARRFKGHVRG
jgi:hypothetical protein